MLDHVSYVLARVSCVFRSYVLCLEIVCPVFYVGEWGGELREAGWRHE